MSNYENLECPNCGSWKIVYVGNFGFKEEMYGCDNCDYVFPKIIKGVIK